MNLFPIFQAKKGLSNFMTQNLKKSVLSPPGDAQQCCYVAPFCKVDEHFIFFYPKTYDRLFRLLRALNKSSLSTENPLLISISRIAALVTLCESMVLCNSEPMVAFLIIIVL